MDSFLLFSRLTQKFTFRVRSFFPVHKNIFLVNIFRFSHFTVSVSTKCIFKIKNNVIYYVFFSKYVFRKTRFFLLKVPLNPPYPQKILVTFDFRNSNNFLSQRILVHLETGRCTVTYPGRWTITYDQHRCNKDHITAWHT